MNDMMEVSTVCKAAGRRLTHPGTAQPPDVRISAGKRSQYMHVPLARIRPLLWYIDKKTLKCDCVTAINPSYPLHSLPTTCSTSISSAMNFFDPPNRASPNLSLSPM
mmetsp:Transcript_16104/g.45819  ORF Transcript_16104/g.45819 Transcript_16104/m.45819 type:complete len:107 (+) Transcript_16104:202-522(+)